MAGVTRGLTPKSPWLALVMAKVGRKLASVMLFAPVLYVAALDGRWQWLEKNHTVIGAMSGVGCYNRFEKVVQFTCVAWIKPVPKSNKCSFYSEAMDGQSLEHIGPWEAWGCLVTSLYVAVHEFLICKFALPYFGHEATTL